MREHQIGIAALLRLGNWLPIRDHRPTACRIGNAVPADLDRLARQVTEILHDHPGTFSIGARVDAHPHRVVTTDGQLLRELHLDPTRDYQPQTKP